MNEQDFEDALLNILTEGNAWPEYGNEGDDEQPTPDRVITNHEAGLLTTNKGLVVRMSDGSEFQLAIVQSKIGRK